jgi:hypothetical protein
MSILDIPIPSTKDVRLHGLPLGERAFFSPVWRTKRPRWACETSSMGDDVVYDWRCRACVAAAMVRLHEFGDFIVFVNTRDGQTVVTTFRVLVKRAERNLQCQN